MKHGIRLKPNNGPDKVIVSTKMIVRYTLFLFSSCVIFDLIGCKDPSSPIPQADPVAFGQYWNQGKAEISSYQLSQANYGANHDGQTILIFVTEDFSKSKQLKLDEPEKYSADAVRIMKLNTMKEFITGIYTYSMMTSVFTPLDREQYPHSLKLTAGSQDWCGQTFMQANWKGNRYEIQQMSYFEKEGDARYTLARALLEDELWTIIRIAPHTLPIGDIKLIASPLFLRLSHRQNKVYEASASLTKKGESYLYTIRYPELNRTLDIEFESIFPHRILGWKEQYGENEQTTGRLLKTVMSDYWNHHLPGDQILRTDLGLQD